MSTFFEKLTGGRSHTPPPPDHGETKEEPKRRPLRYTPVEARKEKPTQIRVETEPALPPTLAPEPPEEEGELTVDIYDKGDSIVIQSTVAGVKPEDLDVSITNDSVTIRGRREREDAIHEENYYYKELFWGTFSRSVILPEEIEEDEAEASLKHGLLAIRLPKKRRGVIQKLKVKTT